MFRLAAKTCHPDPFAVTSHVQLGTSPLRESFTSLHFGPLRPHIATITRFDTSRTAFSEYPSLNHQITDRDGEQRL